MNVSVVYANTNDSLIKLTKAYYESMNTKSLLKSTKKVITNVECPNIESKEITKEYKLIFIDDTLEKEKKVIVTEDIVEDLMKVLNIILDVFMRA
ncbi:hypothetical protein [Clostridium tepidiprofundi]|nr:hypothetical protein [Clostridium tepidiprofundi]